MYVHLGEKVTVPDASVIGIFDLENTTIGQDTRGMLDRLAKENRVVTVSEDMPKSFVVCIDDGGETAYISPISAATLRKRACKLF